MNITPRARALYDELATGWNTWDVRSVTTHVFLPAKVAVTLSFFMPSQSRYRRDIAWENVADFGEHAADGSFTDVTLTLWGRKIRVATCSCGDELLVRVSPFEIANGDLFVAAEVEPLWNAEATIDRKGASIVAATASGEFRLDSPTPTVAPEWNPCRSANLVWSAYETVCIRVNSSRTAPEIDKALAAAEAAWLSRTIHSSGAFEEGLAAMRRCLLWNTLYEPRNRRVISPVTRNWCRPEVLAGGATWTR